MKHTLKQLILISVLCSPILHAETLTNDEIALNNTIKSKLEAQTVAEWSLIFSPILKSADVKKMIGNINSEDWGRLGEAATSLKTITACSIVKDIDSYTVTGEKTGSGEELFKRVREIFDRDC